MIGVPPQDHRKIFDWSNTMIAMGEDPEYGGSLETATKAATEMFAFWDTLAAERREERRDDLLSLLLEAEVEGEKLNQLEFDVFFLLLAVAGNETTRNLISHGMHFLMENPGERDRLLEDQSLLPTAINEMLRMATPVMHFRRTATRDFEMRGQEIKTGDKVILWYIAANRDPEVFEDPHRFDVGRPECEHVTFGGGGAHFCLGFSLAELEIKIMFEELLNRLPDMAMTSRPARLRSSFINGLKHLPVKFTAEHL